MVVEVVAGQVRVDACDEAESGGAPLVELPLEELRGHVALVTQEHHVFLGTLRDNLALARPDADDARIRAALAAVDALDWVDELPDGLATQVGSGKHEVSPAHARKKQWR